MFLALTSARHFSRNDSSSGLASCGSISLAESTQVQAPTCLEIHQAGLYLRTVVAIGFEVISRAIGLLSDLPLRPLHIHVKEVALVKGWSGASGYSKESPANISR